MGVVREPMLLLLMAAAGVYLVLGDVREALVLAASIAVIVAITIVQERRTERALEALRELSSPRALVVREGRAVRVAGADVVRGDLLVVREGDRVAADAVLVESHGVEMDESMLTGESVPVAKGLDPVFGGTLTVKGTGLAEVTATGGRSELGRIGASLAGVDRGKAALEIETARVVRYIAAIGLALCVVTALGYWATRGDALGGVLAGLTLAMAILPEEFPLVLTIFLALGAWRISRHGVLTRKLAAIEMLGSATVLCCDKTGTLTENRMTVVEAWVDGAWRPAGGWGAGETPLLVTAALACEPDAFDPMERAILAAAERAQPGCAARAGTLERRYPLRDTFLAVVHGWRAGPGTATLAMKGAPEAVLPLCGLSVAERAAAAQAQTDAASRGLRLLAVAHAEADGRFHDDPAAYRWRLLGFVALADPVRATVPASVALCRRAGIRVVMITGDHPATARAIASQAGIDATHVVTGAEISAMDDAALQAVLARTQVFARVRPEDKLRLVAALRNRGEIVAMTGDGVNDAPALKAAHIGVAMGMRGSDVAREAASLVLLEDDFTALVGTVRLGRRIYDNIRNAMRFLVAVHVPLAGMAIVPLAAGWPLLLFPVHVVFLEFVIDPACTMVFEAERSDAAIMDRPPRPVGERLFSMRSLVLAFLLGLGVLAAVAGVLGVSLAAGRGDDAARTMAFVTLVCGDIALILANRRHDLTMLEMATRENKPLAWIAVGTAVALAIVVYVPAVAHLFRFAPASALDLAICAGLGFGSVAWYDFYKVARRKAAVRVPAAARP